jgi:hypothetical protein
MIHIPISIKNFGLGGGDTQELRVLTFLYVLFQNENIGLKMFKLNNT